MGKTIEQLIEEEIQIHEWNCRNGYKMVSEYGELDRQRLREIGNAIVWLYLE